MVMMVMVMVMVFFALLLVMLVVLTLLFAARAGNDGLLRNGQLAGRGLKMGDDIRALADDDVRSWAGVRLIFMNFFQN